ncbi:helix-turn-helix domain-containing protein [Salmonella enterica]|nr:helix-turn-helix domain-containing protein [Salmonella enterica]
MVIRNTVNEILKWIESHVEERISIEDIVKYSGFSRRYVYTIFKNYTGMPIGTYIRKRRLCRAAYKLKLTSASLADIAYSLGFDSPQSFSREFKKIFCVNPKAYRDNEVWDMSHLQIPIIIEPPPPPKVDLCHLNEQEFYGYEHTTRENYIDILNGKSNLNKWELVQKKIIHLGGEVFFITRFSPSPESSDCVNISTFIGTDKKSKRERYMTDLRCEPEGQYAHFSFDGEWGEYMELYRRVYSEILPKMKLKRRNGEDMERIRHDESQKDNCIKCDCYVPISF